MVRGTGHDEGAGEFGRAADKHSAEAAVRRLAGALHALDSMLPEPGEKRLGRVCLGRDGAAIEVKAISMLSLIVHPL